MGLLTLVAENTSYDTSTFTLQIPNGIPCLHNRISLVGWAVHKNPALLTAVESAVRVAGGNDAGIVAPKMLKVKIPWLSSASSLVLGKEGNTVDKSQSIVLPLNGANTYESQQDIAQHFDVNDEVIPTSFTMDILNMNNTPSRDVVLQLILFFQFETKRLL